MTQNLSYPQAQTTQFTIGHGTAWAQALWWNRLGNNSSISHFVLSLDQYMEDPSPSFGIEYNVNQLLNGEWYKFSTQCSFGDGIWQVWDSANQHWTPTAVPCQRPSASSHVQLQMQYERVNGQAHFIAISINGTSYPVDKYFNPQSISGTSGDFGVHFQLNGDANSDPYSVWVHNYQLIYW
jgi:hypothetical protein